MTVVVGRLYQIYSRSDSVGRNGEEEEEDTTRREADGTAKGSANRAEIRALGTNSGRDSKLTRENQREEHIFGHLHDDVQNCAGSRQRH